MFRDMLSGSRAILVGLVLFVLVVAGSLLYSWHIHRTTDAEVAETHRKVQPLENKNEMSTAADTTDTSTVDFEQTPLETNDTQPIAEETAASTDDEAENVDLTDIFLPEDFVSEEAPDEDVPVSPFGFGPYPEVPADYFGVPIWMQDSGLPDHAQREIELIDRVLVKLWQQGDRSIVGGSTYNGKIYPHYENTAYIRWSESASPDGTIHRYISRIKSGLHPSIHRQIRDGDIPPGINIVDLDDAGIDPYVFWIYKNKEKIKMKANIFSFFCVVTILCLTLASSTSIQGSGSDGPGGNSGVDASAYVTEIESSAGYHKYTVHRATAYAYAVARPYVNGDYHYNSGSYTIGAELDGGIKDSDGNYYSGRLTDDVEAERTLHVRPENASGWGDADSSVYGVQGISDHDYDYLYF